MGKQKYIVTIEFETEQPLTRQVALNLAEDMRVQTDSLWDGTYSEFATRTNVMNTKAKIKKGDCDYCGKKECVCAPAGSV